jgi:polyhydroxybutyrate depolymerase
MKTIRFFSKTSIFVLFSITCLLLSSTVSSLSAEERGKGKRFISKLKERLAGKDDSSLSPGSNEYSCNTTPSDMRDNNSSETVEKTFTYTTASGTEVERKYLIHLPVKNFSKRSGSVPLIVCLHGGQGNGYKAEESSEFSQLSEKYRFIVIYPHSDSTQWNDGRGNRTSPDDVEFLSKLIQTLKTQFTISKVIMCGVSNGSIMTHRFAIEKHEMLAGIGCIAASIAEDYPRPASPSIPLSVIIIHGTSDPLAPYEGGPIRNFGHGPRGNIISVDDTISFWKNANGGVASVPVKIELISDTVPEDESTAEKTIITCRNGKKVVFFKVINGGHSWPGCEANGVGKVCMDFHASEEIIKFFILPNRKGSINTSGGF